MLVHNESSINIIFGAIFDKMKFDHELTPINSPMFGFMGNIILSRGKITLTIEIGMAPLMTHHIIEFLVVDSHLEYLGGLL